MRIPRGMVAACLAALALGAAPADASLEGRISSAESSLSSVRARERALSSSVAAFSGLAARLESDISVLTQRQQLIQSDLDAKEAELRRTTAELRRARAALARLRARLRYSRLVLGRRLVELYKSDRPDIVTVVLSSKGFADLLERGEFIRRIGAQDRRIVYAVRTARDAAHVASVRLRVIQGRQQEVAAVVRQRRDEVAGTRMFLASKRDGYVRARSDAQAALSLASSSRRNLESSLSSLQSEQARLSSQQSGAGSLSLTAGWAIPWNIVNCESGGRNTGPNNYGASGYYQIIPSTWKGFGGHGPAAHLAPKSEQDRVAARIYRGGRGVSNWTCAGR